MANPANSATPAEGSDRLERKEFSGIPVFVRTGTPDQIVARSCLGKEFETVIDLVAKSAKPKIVLDLGGYIGTAAIAFATRIPNARVITLEPSPDNFRVLALNIASYPNIVGLNAAIGSKKGTAPIFARHTGEWGHTLVDHPRDCAETTLLAQIPVVTVEELLAEYGEGRIPALVKCDIEGGEVDLLSRPEWVDAWAVVTAELHDRIIRGCRKAWDRVFATRQGVLEVYVPGEKRIAVNVRSLRALHGAS